MLVILKVDELLGVLEVHILIEEVGPPSSALQVTVLVLAVDLVAKLNLVGEVDGAVQDHSLEWLACGLTSERAGQELLCRGLDV